MSSEQWINLVCHPMTDPGKVRAIRTSVNRSANAELRIAYRLEGDLSRIRFSSPGTHRVASELWRHTCFEAFIAAEGETAYSEFNVAPSGEWSVYAFSNYRIREAWASQPLRPQIAMRCTRDRLELDALIRLDRLCGSYPGIRLRIGLAAIIEAREGFSYWALRHPAAKPDFHHAEGFALQSEASLER